MSIIYLYTLDNYWKPFWDSAIYISLAKSLAAGNGYYYMGLPHAKYPFIFPLMLAPIIKVCGLNFFIMRLLIIVLTISSFYLIYILFKKCTDEGMALAIMLLTGFSSSLLHLSTWILSEVPYMFFSLCTLYFFIDYDKESRWLTKAGFLSSIFLLFTIFTRMIGLTLGIAILLHLLLSRGAKGYFTHNIKKMVLIGVIISIPLSSWFYRSYLINQQFPFQPEYRGVLNYQREFFVKVPDNIHTPSITLADFVTRIQDNVRIYIGITSDVMVNNVPFKIFRFITMLLFLYGFLWCFFKRRTVVEYYFSLYLTVCIIWWFNLHSVRFITPVIPFVFYYLLTGIKRGLELLSYQAHKGAKNTFEMVKRPAFILVVFILAINNFSFNPSVIKEERRKNFYPPALLSEFLSAIKWINEYTTQDTVAMASEAPWFFMLTDRRTLTFPLFEPLSYIIDSLITNRVEYIVLSNIEYEIYILLHTFVESHPQHFLKVFTNNKTSVYKIALDNLALLKDEINKIPSNKTQWQK